MQYPVLNQESIKADISKTKAKIPLLLKGNWHVPGFGLMSVTDDYIDKLTNNFKTNALGFKPYATLGHPTDSPDPESIDGERKRGDLEDIVKEGDIVYGIYNINEETYNLLKKGDYEYSSPEIQQKFRDKQTGEVIGPALVRTALTNAPFMPFNENKITLLSQTNNERTFTPMFIKLSTTVEESQIAEDKVEGKTEVISTEVLEEVPILETKQETTNQNLIETKMTLQEEQTVAETSKVDFEAILNKLVESQQTNFTAAIDAVTNKFNESLQAINTKTAETINGVLSTVQELSSKVDGLTNKAEKIDETSQYITALSSSEKAKALNGRLNELFQTGNVSPAALSLAKSIISSVDNSSVVKLSTIAGETELPLEDSVIALVKLSANIMPSVNQAGATGESKKESYIQTIINSNLEKATKNVRH